MAEMFTLFPHESAVVMQRGIELGVICSCALVLHCSALVIEFWSSNEFPDSILRFLCLIRIICALPRPYFWFVTRRLFMQARYQPTPQMVTRRLLDIYAHPHGMERALFFFYYGWLCVMACIMGFVRFEGKQTVFTQQLWRHCLLNFVSIVLHRILCVVMFYYLMQSDFKRGIPREVLEKYTKCLVFTESAAVREKVGGEDMECSICIGSYVEGEEIRKLMCGHHFHQECVDLWLMRHQNRCPLCLEIVGPSPNQ
eukprot:TRINITY_DN617_c1_g1_i1.p1 TRINITY_DN617_c1_g1~~TRINITY_DN617_c1_g1_i1.p1  ORF type:complete len:255 (+),score=27.90 TRINITY_DN617_c1_g1_i1:102-866(+)